MSDQPTATNKRTFKVGGTRIAEDASTAALTNEQVQALLKTRYPEIANATIRETENADGRLVEYLPQAGRKG